MWIVRYGGVGVRLLLYIDMWIVRYEGVGVRLLL